MLERLSVGFSQITRGPERERTHVTVGLGTLQSALGNVVRRLEERLYAPLLPCVTGNAALADFGA